MGHANRSRLHHALCVDTQSGSIRLPASGRREPNAYANCNSHRYSDANSYCDSNGYSHFDTYAYCYSYTSSKDHADSKASPDAKASTVILQVIGDW
jgi:hypothetical protein